MKRRLLSFVLAFAMLLSVTPVAVFAAGGTELNLAGAGTETDPYLIQDLDDLIEFRESVNTYQSDGSNQYKGKYFKLTADIDLAGINWEPIGKNTQGDHQNFLGTFDGGGHTISNLNINADGDHLGFFARVGSYAEGITPTVKNLKFHNVNVSSNTTTGHGGSYVGGVIANAGGNSVVSGIEVTGDVYVAGYGYVGGIVGHGYPDIDNCSVVANDGSYIRCHYWCCGGIIGYAGEGGTPITNSSVSGLDIWSAYGGAGAVAGLLQDGNKLENVSASNVEITSNSDYCMGYIAGNGNGSTMTDVTMTNVTATANGAAISATDAVATIGNKIYSNLAGALAEAANTKDIVIDLVNNATLDITAWQTLAIGGADTETITINGNGHTLVFNKLNSDWNHVATNNNAKLILSDMTLSDSGYNNGPWNRYDINFACDVELNNVVSNKALAFKADATLNNVTVNESGDNYAIWIQADGQTVVANGLTVNAANGRGIKIDEQYVTNAAKVDLTVTNAEFTTAKKAAILVKTAGGADISVANVDISKVAADPINVVWVDEDSADNFNDVTVNGGRPVIESANGAIEGLNYVSLGDSMSNGYGLDGYDANNGVEDYGDKSYANQFATWLAQNNDAVVNHAQLAMSAMRAEDLHWLLEVDYDDPSVIATIETLQSGNWTHYGHLWNETFTNGDYWTWRELIHDYRFDIAAAYIEHLETAEHPVSHVDVPLNCITNGADMTGVEREAIYAHYTDVQALAIVAKYYQESVANADVISLGMGNGNFGVFMFGRIMEAVGFGGTPDEAMIYDVERAIAECPANVQQEILVLKDQLYNLIETKLGMSIESNPTLNALANTAIYTGLSYVLNYAGSVEAILQRNPDAEIILVALMNTFNDPAEASRAIPGLDNVTIGDLLDLVFTPLNAYIAALPTCMQAAGNSVYANATFYYAEADRVECLVEVYEDEIKNKDNMIIRDRFVTDIVGESGDLGMIWKLLSGVQLVEGVALVPVTLAEVCAYDSMSDTQKAAYAATNKKQAISIAVYLAFEDAIMKAADGAPVSIASILNLGSIMSGGMSVFGGVMDSFKANIGTAGTAYFNTAVAVVAGGQGVAPDVIVGLYATTPEVKASVDMLCMLLALPETLSAAVQNDPSLQGLLGLFARCVIGNGLGAHPSETGHNQLAAAVINAYDTGYTAEDQTKENLKVAIPAAYAEAYKYALENGYIGMAKDYIAIASDAVLAADNYVHALVVPAQLEKTRALLQAELANTLETLAKANALLDITVLTPETWAQILAMEDQLYIHMATLEDLAAELGVVGNIALDQIDTVVGYYAALINTVTNNAYAWVINGVVEFNAEYLALVEKAGAMADQVDPALGTAVRKFMTETPADALAILYAYGEEALLNLFIAAVDAADDVYVAATALAAVLKDHGVDIYRAIMNDPTCQALRDKLIALNNELAILEAEVKNTPVSTSLALYAQIDAIKAQAMQLAVDFYNAAIAAVAAADPIVAQMLDDAIQAFLKAVGTVGEAADGYAAWLPGHANAMAGELLTALLANWDEFAGVAGPIVDEIIWQILYNANDYVEGVIDEVENQIRQQLAILEAELLSLKSELETAVGEAKAQIQSQIDAIYAKITELKAALAAGITDNVLRIYQLLDEIKNDVITLANAAMNAALTEAHRALSEIAANLAQLDEIIKNTIGNKYTEFKAQIGILATHLLDKLVETAIRVAPEIDAQLYDFFYNNPDKVIAFMEEYSDVIFDIIAEYGDEALGTIGVALFLYGEDLAEYLIENREAVLAGIMTWADKYGERTAAMLQIYAEALGMCDIVRAEIAKLEEKIDALEAQLTYQIKVLNEKLNVELDKLNEQLSDLYAQLETAIGEQKAILEAKIAEIKALIAQVEMQIEQVKAFIAEIQDNLANAQQQLAELSAKMQNLVSALLQLDDALKYLLDAGIEAATPVIQQALDGVANAVRDLVGVISTETAEQLDKMIREAKDFLNRAFYDATHANYPIDAESSYVSLGDNKEVARLFAEYLKDYVAKEGVNFKYNTTDLSVENARISDLASILAENVSTIASADLISLNYSYDAIAEETLNILLDLLLEGNTAAMTDHNWAALAGESAATEIEAFLANLHATMVAQGFGVTLSEMIGFPVESNVTIADAAILAVEHFAYSAVEYAVLMPQTVLSIQQINPDALIMVNAMSNPLAGAYITLLGEEFHFGDYIDYIVDATNVECTIFAAVTENVVFIPATKINTNCTGAAIIQVNSLNDVIDLMYAYKAGSLIQINPTAEGNAYAASKMAESLTITVEAADGLLGDANNDGIVNSIDSAMILQYDVNMIAADMIFLAVCDVNGDGSVNSIDAAMILQFDVGMIDQFPAAVH